MGITAINGIAITASLANTASAFTVTDTTTGTGPYYFVFVDSTSGGKTPRVDSSTLTYNATTNAITAASFIGTASQASTASIAVTASEVISRVVPFGSTFFPTFVQNNNAANAPEPIYTHPSYSVNTSTLELRANLINNQSAGSNSSTSTSNLTIDASTTQSMYWVASFAATQSLIINNLTQGRHVRVYIRNTNATQRHIIFSGSTTTSGHSGINMAVSVGGSSITTQPISATNGTMLAHIENIGGFIVGGLM
jgi:hypothetical protein